MEDPHVLLCSFICGLHEEEAQARQLAMDAHVVELTTFVNSIFGGRLSSTVSGIQCSHQSTKLYPFLDILLSIPTEVFQYQLKTVGLYLLHISCYICAQIVLVYTDWPMASPIWVVASKRFECITGKPKELTEHVRFKEVFGMQPFIEQRYRTYLYFSIPVNFLCLDSIIVQKSARRYLGGDPPPRA
jgi:hypothetical protein